MFRSKLLACLMVAALAAPAVPARAEPPKPAASGSPAEPVDLDAPEPAPTPTPTPAPAPAPTTSGPTSGPTVIDPDANTPPEPPPTETRPARVREPYVAPLHSDTADLWQTGGWVVAAMGGVSLVAGAVFGFQAISKKSDAEKAGCKDNRCPTEAAASTRDDARSAGNLSTALVGTGAALVGAAIAVWILKPGAPASVQVEAGPTAITVSGAWR